MVLQLKAAPNSISGKMYGFTAIKEKLKCPAVENAN
jgi:hypothetical protein